MLEVVVCGVVVLGVRVVVDISGIKKIGGVD